MLEHIQKVFQKSIIAIIDLPNSRVVNDSDYKILGNTENEKKIQKITIEYYSS